MIDLAKMYCGDGVYAATTQFGELQLTTEDGISVTNTIVLEPDVWEALLEFASRSGFGAK